MAQLKDIIQNGLDEDRILVLCVQIFLGFQYRAVFEPRFDSLPFGLQIADLAALYFSVVLLGLLLLPTMHHRLVERGNDTYRLNRFLTGCMQPVLPLFLLTLGIEIFTSTFVMMGGGWAALCGGGVVLLGGGSLVRMEAVGWGARKGAEAMSEEAKHPKTELKDRIRQVLTETRVVLPGAQALLGFQLITVLMTGFEVLPFSSKLVHLLSLMLTALSILLLIAPAARHRLVEKGEETASFHTYASRMVVAAIVPLGLGTVGDLFIVARKISASVPASLILAGSMLVLLFGLWFGLPLWLRSRDSRRAAI